MTRGWPGLDTRFKLKPTAVVLILLLCLVATGLTLPAYAAGGYSAGPHKVSGGSALKDSSGSDAEVPIWEAPPLTLAEYSLAIVFVTLGAGCLIPVIGRIRDVLSHDKRKAIYDFICRNPGSTIADISADLSMNIGTVYHHLWMLKARRKVFFESQGKFVRVYEGRLASSDRKLDRAIYAHARNDISKRLLQAMLESPGLNNMALSKAVGLDKSTICWYMQRFRKDGIVEMVRDGRQKRCYINAKAGGILKEYVGA